MCFSGPNGPRFTQDLQWMEGRKRKRAVVRVRLARAALIDLASPDVKILARTKIDPDVRQAYIRAALDHYERRQAEIDQEAENRKRGDHNPVFLEARPITGGVDIKQRKGREPLRLLPDHVPVVSLGDAYSHDDGPSRPSGHS
jgi:hypothetical protein